MTLGAEPKKVAILGVLVVAGVVAVYMNSSGDSAPSPAPRTAVTGTPNAGPGSAATLPARTKARANGEFRYRVLGSRPDDKTDPASIDPELKLDLLAKVQAVPPLEGGRNLFQFGTAPAPDKPLPAVPKSPTIAINQPAPRPTTNVLSSAPAGPPPAPPINLKYYGYDVAKDGHKKAFLLDGDDIFMVTENQTVKQRYRIVRIATTSIEIEDTQSKSTQTIKLQDPPA